MKQLQLVWLVILAISFSALADDAVLPRGLGFRIAGQADTAEQIRDDIKFIRQGIVESAMDGALRSKLDKLLAAAFDELGGKTPEDSSAIREGFEREAGKLLSVPQRDEIKRRTIIVFAEAFWLNNGMDPSQIDDNMIVKFRLSAGQTARIRASLKELQDKLSGDLQAAGSKSSFAVITAARKEMRGVLTLAQRTQLDETIENALKAAAAGESNRVKKKEP